MLDQGYWPESTLTPPSDEAIQYDIKHDEGDRLQRARKHQKVEDPRFLYWADKMGLAGLGRDGERLLTSSESTSSGSRGSGMEAVARDYNHPSIVAWVPINESWGVPQILTNAAQQAHLKSLYHLTKSLDATRLVIDNDGWEHTDTTDLLTLHDYARTGDGPGGEVRASETRAVRASRETAARRSPSATSYNGSPLL